MIATSIEINLVTILWAIPIAGILFLIGRNAKVIASAVKNDWKGIASFVAIFLCIVSLVLAIIFTVMPDDPTETKTLDKPAVLTGEWAQLYKEVSKVNFYQTRLKIIKDFVERGPVEPLSVEGMDLFCEKVNSSAHPYVMELGAILDPYVTTPMETNNGN